jgi:hypothetical protein
LSRIFGGLKKEKIFLLSKSHYFFKKILIEKTFIDIFLCIINITRINAQLFMELKKKINKYIYNNEANRERIDKTN